MRKTHQLDVCVVREEPLANEPAPELLLGKPSTCTNPRGRKLVGSEDRPAGGETLTSGLPERDIRAMIDLFQLLQRWDSSA